MHANELPTVGYLHQWFQALYTQGQARPAEAAADGAVVLYSVAKLALVLDVHADTVRRWLKRGKRGRDGRLVKLRAYEFTSEPRIPWPAVLAYERGEDFDLASLPAPLLVPELVAAAPPAPPAEPAGEPVPAGPQEPPVMRVA